MKKNILLAILGLVISTTTWAAPIELRPDLTLRGSLQLGFRCHYDSRDDIGFLLLFKTSQPLGKIPATLWWSAYDTSTGRYYLPWMHYEASLQRDSKPVTFVIESRKEKEAHPLLVRLKSTEIHFSVDGSEANLIYKFLLGTYRTNAVDYFYDATHPGQHCEVREMDLP